MARVAAVPPIIIVPGITHTFLVDDLGTLDAACAQIVNDQSANLLALRVMDPTSRITTLNGRETGTKVDLTKFSFFDYQMRRKAESLQYRKNQSYLSKKQQYSKINKTTSGSYYYSSKDVTQLLNNQNLNCPNLDVIVRVPTNSGVHDYKYPGYYYDANVPYLPSL
jgi:hypothetical protein